MRQLAGIGRCMGRVVVCVALGSGLFACSSSSLQRAPVEDASGTGPRSVSAQGASQTVRPVQDNAGKPGYYTVRPGDTLIKIGLDAGQNWRDIGRWNNLENLNLIEPGQVLRVAPPTTAADPAVVVRPINSAVVTAVAAPAPVPAASTPRGTSTQAVSGPVTPLGPAATGSDEELSWVWPAAGKLLSGFDEVKNKGLDLGGQAGEPVLAAADGRVVYAGSNLRGYGNLVILKHNNTFLTAYAHNQTLLVKEDQAVRRGQKIAEMGSSDTDRVKLHFEIRRQGKPVDPSRYLPAR